MNGYALMLVILVPIYISKAQQTYDLMVTHSGHLSDHEFHMYQPHTVTNWTLGFEITTTTSLIIPANKSVNPGYELYFGRHEGGLLQAGEAPLEINLLDTEERYQFVLNVSFFLPGPEGFCDTLDALCVRIFLPKLLPPELVIYDIHDSNDTNNIACVSFEKKCQLPSVDIALQGVKVRHADDANNYFSPGQNQIFLYWTIVNLSRLYVNQSNSNFDFEISLRLQDATTIRYKTKISNVDQTSNDLAPETELAFTSVRAIANINQQHDCPQLKYFCLRVRPGVSATYREINNTNNEMCIALQPGGDAQLRCPYDIQILDFEFLRLRPSEKVEPDEEFPVQIDVVLENASPYDLQPSQTLQLQFLIMSSETLTTIDVKSSALDLQYPLLSGIKAGHQLRLNNVNAEFAVSEETCDDNEEQVLCAHVSTTKPSAMVLVNGETSRRCIPFHLECVNHGGMTYLQQIGIVVGLSIVGSVVLIVVGIKLRKRYKRKIRRELELIRTVLHTTSRSTPVLYTTSGSTPVLMHSTSRSTPVLTTSRFTRQSSDYDGYITPEMVSEEEDADSDGYERMNRGHSDEDNEPSQGPPSVPSPAPRLSLAPPSLAPPPPPPSSRTPPSRPPPTPPSLAPPPLPQRVPHLYISYGRCETNSSLPEEEPVEHGTVVEKAKVLWNYSAAYPDELTLKERQVVVVLNKHAGGGWWKGELNGKKGVFPNTFVELLPPEVPAPVPNRETAGEPVPDEQMDEDSKFEYDCDCPSDDETTLDNEPVLEVKSIHLPSNITREDVSFMRYNHSYHRPRISGDQIFICMVKSDIRDKQASEVFFRTHAKWTIPIDSTSNPDLQILYSATGTPESWEPIYGEYADYAESTSVTVSGSRLTFTTLRVGLFAVVKLKEKLRRNLLVFLKPIDIELQDHVFLQVFAVKKSNIKAVENQQLRDRAYLCSNSEVTFEFKSTSMSGLKVEIDDVQPINHWKENNISADISYENLCIGDLSSQVEVKFTKYKRHSLCSSICGNIKVQHSDNFGKTSFDSQRIQREIVLKERRSHVAHDQSISPGSHHVNMESNMQHHTQPLSCNSPHCTPHCSPHAIRSNMHPQPTCASCATGNPHHPHDSNHINVPAHHGRHNHSPHDIRPIDHDMRRKSHGVRHHIQPINEDMYDYGQGEETEAHAQPNRSCRKYVPDPTIEAIEQEVVPDETGSYSNHRVKPATRNIISPKSYDMTGNIKGRAFILNNFKFDRETQLTQRNGSDVDFDNAIHVFEELGYQVKGARNETAEQINISIKEFAASFRGRSKYKSSVVFLMSHGNHKGICGTDGKLFLISDLHKIFDTNNCPQLKGKPKLFFIQACRTETGVVRTADTGQQTELDRQNEEVTADNNSADVMADMYTSFPTVHGFVSLRHEFNGSWFVQAVVEVFLAQSHENSLGELMTMVRNRVLNMKGRMKNPATQQMENVRAVPEGISSLTKTLHFLPVGSDNTNAETS